MLKQSLQLKISQQLTMTPQLQQAIKLLQLSTLDLQQEIQQALDSNPMLEVVEESENPEGSAQNTENAEVGDKPNNEDLSQVEDLSIPEASSNTDQAEADWNDDQIPNDLPVDSSWDDVYQPSPASTSMAAPNEDREYEKNGTTESLQSHLLWQLNLTNLSEKDQIIGIAIIDAVEPSGALSISAEEIHSGLDKELEIELDEVMAILHLIQQFDPVGCACHDLKECLLVQLNNFPPDTPFLASTKTVISEHLSLLANRDYKQLMRKSKLSENDLKSIIELIQNLHPRPGEQIAPSTTEYVIPDVFVRKANGRWLVELNPEIAPKVRINSDYASLVKRADSSADNTYLKDNLQEARWFLKSLQSRNETLMKVAIQIVEHQRGFLEYGEEAMKPLVLHDIAEVVDMHESTISRVTTQKYMHTPRGIFELKYFFSSHVSTSSGGECSSTAIRAMIKKLVSEEDAKKPLSDSKISKLLEEQGIEVARRTIAKYRESMSIPPSNERKRLV